MSAASVEALEVDLLVVGAGPHALTLMSYLAQVDPGIVERTLVVDPRGWLEAWRARFAAHEIPMLRSACVHHPHPDPYRLLEWARQRDYADPFTDSIGRPSTRVFDDFTDALVADLGLESRRRSARVRAVRQRGERVLVQLDDGCAVVARDVVVATNPVRPSLPAWAVAEGLRRGRPILDGDVVGLGHGDDVVLARDARPGRRVLVLGGGLTAAQLADGATRRGCEVTLVSRAPLVPRDLDVEAVWLGPYLERFHRTRSHRDRWHQLRAARSGGTIPPRELRALRKRARSGRIRLHEGARIDRLERSPRGWAADLGPHGRGHFDSVWLATGHRLAWSDERCLTGVVGKARTAQPSGLPLLTRDLRVPGTRVRLSGGLAALQVGPLCRTLAGARMSSERIAAELVGRTEEPQYPQPS